MKAMEVGTFEAKNRLSELLAQVERGQRVYITRRGKRVALLAPIESEKAKQQAGRKLLHELRSFRKVAKTGRESLQELIEEGRR